MRVCFLRHSTSVEETSMPETKRHLQLKDIALAWLRAAGCRAVALEVSCPFHRYRFDALGWLDHADAPAAVAALASMAPSSAMRASSPLQSDPHGPRVIAIECKQSRSDFASDDVDPAELAARKEYLLQRRQVIEELRVKVRETHLKVEGSSLFEELATWEFGHSRIHAYRNVLTQLAAIDAKMGIDTKFAQVARWRAADHLLLMTPAGLLRPREVPAGWGLIEVDSGALRKSWHAKSGAPLPCVTRVMPVALAMPAHRRVRLLRNLAVAASRGVGYGVAEYEKPARNAVKSRTPATAAPTNAAHDTLFSFDHAPRSDTMARHPEPR